MRTLKKYLLLRKHIRNWISYKEPKGNEKVRYITRGIPLKLDVTRPFWDVFEEIFIEDFYVTNKLLTKIPADGVIVDVGANVGFFSFLLLSKLKKARIYAFEPMQGNVDVFRGNIALNKDLAKRVTVYHKALTGDHTGPLEIFYDAKNHNPIIASVYKDFSADNNNTQRVEAISLHDFISSNNISTIDLLKLDCEGSEYPILYNSSASVWTVIKGMAIEVHNLDNDKRNVSSLIEFLSEKGYDVKKKVAFNDCYSLSAFRK